MYISCGNRWILTFYFKFLLNMNMNVAQSCPTLCDPMDYTVHGILQARIPEWVAFSFSRGSSQPRDQTQVSHSACAFFTSWATREAQEYWSGRPMPFARDLLDPRIELGFSTLQKDSLPTEPQGKPKFLLEYSWFTRLY